MGGCPNRWGATCLRRNLALRAAQGKKLILGAILFNSKALRRKNQQYLTKIKLPKFLMQICKKKCLLGRYL